MICSYLMKPHRKAGYDFTYLYTSALPDACSLELPSRGLAQWMNLYLLLILHSHLVLSNPLIFLSPPSISLTYPGTLSSNFTGSHLLSSTPLNTLIIMVISLSAILFKGPDHFSVLHLIHSSNLCLFLHVCLTNQICFALTHYSRHPFLLQHTNLSSISFQLPVFSMSFIPHLILLHM